MKRIDTATRALNLFGAGKDGFKDGDLANGIVPTDFNAAWCNLLQEEVANVIEAAGIALDGSVRTQLLQALRGGGFNTAVDTGAANVRVVNYAAPAITALVDGMVLRFKSVANNTGATTLNVNGLGAKPLLGAGQSALQGGELVTNGKCEVVWSASSDAFILLSSTGGTQQVSAGTQTGHAVNLGQFAGTKATNGYQRLPGGLILQWATGNASNGAGASNNFPIAFPTACLAIVSTHQGTDGTVNIITSALSATGVVFITNYAGTATAVYMAFGF
jgi:hypothetical protein